jgi:apolipoprotein N-acyltransferase
VSRGSLIREGAPIKVGLVQGNIPQDAKGNPDFRAAISERYIALSREVVAAGAQLVLWPEASVPFIFASDAPAAAPIRRLASEAHVPFLLGTDVIEPAQNGAPERYYNAATLVGSNGATVGVYRKVRLVPFGEYVPYKRLLFFVGPLIDAVSDFTPGDELSVFETEGSRFSVAICYEAVYAGIAQTFVTKGSQLLTTITNDAWFGRTSAPYQHFAQASMRAIEEGRYLVRSANTGISGVVDPYGRVIVETRLYEPAVVVAEARFLKAATIYSRLGDLFAYASVVLTLALLVGARRRVQ